MIENPERGGRSGESAPGPASNRGAGAPIRPTKPPASKGRRLTSQLVALSSAAILSVYAAGYLRTLPAEAQIAAEQAKAASVLTPSASTAAPPASTPVASTSAPTAAAPSGQPADNGTPWWLQSGSGLGTSGDTNPTAASADPSGASSDASGSARPSRGVTGDSSGSAPTPATTPADSSAAIAPTATAEPATQSAAVAPSTATRVPPTATRARPSPTSVPATPTVAASPYKDGTFTGSGYSRHGGVTAKVVIKGGKILSAAIADCTTRYPCSDISPLPSEVVSAQSPQIDYVSGATDSSMAYVGAVQDALSQASA